MPKTFTTWIVTFPLLVSVGLSAGWTGAVQAQEADYDDPEFKQFQQQYQQQFADFEQQHWQEFEAFAAQWRAAEQAYLQQLGQVWEQPELTDRTRYISYSDDAQEKTVVDYEQNTVTVEVRGSVSRVQLQQKLQRQLTRLQQTSVGQALHQDPVIKQLPEALQQQLQVQNSAPVIEAGVAARVDEAEVEGAVKDDVAVDTDEAVAVKKPAPQPQVSRSASSTKITIKLPAQRQQARIKRILPSVKVYAQKHGLSVPLVLAIIHTESSFNPLARSHIPAFGLMQIVPTSAGKDISDYLYGEQQLFSPAYLFDPDNNIEAGSVYYYLLNRRYFKQVRDDQVRELLSIAAYNTGPGNVARTFGDGYSLAQASAAANKLSQVEAYKHLMTYLPAQETKNYLQKITRRQSYYQQLVEAL